MSEATHYRWASLVVESDVPLPELREASGKRPPHIVVSRASRRRSARVRTRCHEWRLPDGTRWATVAAEGPAHVMQFGRLAEFIIGGDGRSIQWRAPRATRPETLRHLLLDQVLPTLAFEHGMLSLHASAVSVTGGAVAFAGPSSRGKSTLAASFALDGHAVVTDDCLMLRWRRHKASAIPSYPSLRLWTETAARVLGPALAPQALSPVAQYTSKVRLDRRVTAIGFCRRPAALRRIYLLERGRGPTQIEMLSRQQAYIELLKITFRLNPLDKSTLHREVAALDAVSGLVAVARLRVPSRLGALADVRRAILKDLEREERRP